MTVREFVPELVDTIRALRDPNITEEEAARELGVYSAGINESHSIQGRE